MKKLILCFAFVFTQSGLAVAKPEHSALRWSLNDVSILLPLPKSTEIAKLWGTQTEGLKGELLPVSVFENLPHIVVGTNRKEIYGQHLRAIAIRIDPCFEERDVPLGCRHQIRIVWQPVIASGSASITMDAAIHSFYDLSSEEWDSLLAELTPLASQDTKAALGVHPVIAKEGLGGPHWKQLSAILLKYIGANNISRATAMTVDTLGSIWTFSGVNIQNGVQTRIQIPRVDRIAQGFIADITDLKEFRTSITPYPADAIPFLHLALDSKRARLERTEEQIREGLAQALLIENPKMEDTGSMDCVSCHIAQNVRLWAEREFPKADFKQDFKGLIYDSSQNLKNTSGTLGFVNRMRAFGYFVDEVSISQRVIHESAEVLTRIQTQTCGQLLKK